MVVSIMQAETVYYRLYQSFLNFNFSRKLIKNKQPVVLCLPKTKIERCKKKT
jgi:hypothetical protein